MQTRALLLPCAAPSVKLLDFKFEKQNIFLYIRFSSIFIMLFSKSNANENRWKTFCTTLFKADHIFPVYWLAYL